MSQSVTHEEYEDDFEKDLDWLISEEGKSDQDPEYEDIEAQIDKELEEDEDQVKEEYEEQRGSDAEDGGEEERWPTPMEPLEGVLESEGDAHYKSAPVAPSQAQDAELDEEKKYILEKIQQANRQLQDQEAPNCSRRRRLHFKDTLVDLVVPAQEHGLESASQRKAEGEGSAHKDTEVNGEVSGKMLKLKISPRDEGPAPDRAAEGEGQGEAGREGRVLVEKDGKFDLVSLKEVESHGLLPPLACSHGDTPNTSPRQSEPGLFRSKSPTSSLRPNSSSALFTGTEPLHTPKPPSRPRNRPNSASHSQQGAGTQGSKRRVQSASGTPSHATYTLSSQQKELLLKLQHRRERITREEQQKREEEEQKRQENELAFRAWLMRKREQLQDERRVQKAQEMERMNCRREYCDPRDAFKAWLQRKHEQQLRERQLEEMKRLEEESGFYLHNREECERAFKHWLKRKQAEKRTEQQAARVRSRRMVLEERRARRMQDLLCTVNEAKAFRFTDHYGYRF